MRLISFMMIKARLGEMKSYLGIFLASSAGVVLFTKSIKSFESLST